MPVGSINGGGRIDISRFKNLDETIGKGVDKNGRFIQELKASKTGIIAGSLVRIRF